MKKYIVTNHYGFSGKYYNGEFSSRKEAEEASAKINYCAENGLCPFSEVVEIEQEDHSISEEDEWADEDWEWEE